MKSIIVTILLILSLISFIGYFTNKYLNLPEVHFTSGGECVRVINHSGSKYDCENMPIKYINYIVRL